jgi:hypothetical protein
MDLEEQLKKMSQLIAKCWADESFKQKLLFNPAATLKAEGVELPVDVPADATIKAVENTDKVYHLVIPAKPTGLSVEDLNRVAGGACCMSPTGCVPPTRHM